MIFSLLSLIILWAISVCLGFFAGTKQKSHQKTKLQKPKKEESIEIKRIKKAEKDFWYFDGSINTQNNNKI